ncbi:hypothetical protein JFN88_21290 [Paenibacillus sp. MAHUQ-46]|uniref:Uncharacterized protein n=1 Tax=Paenibacillus roseus TaxID=2798579 RepID=A0A934J2V1_9BACL|nr:hypothetical protein [Paenibacillus roseus]
MSTNPLNRYEDAAALLSQIGILPLAPLIPEHPSLVSLTSKDQWHTDLPSDPWGWRVRFPSSGAAAYGKFIKSKAVLIDRDWFPLVVAAAGGRGTVEQRYRDGLISKTARDIYEIVSQEEGIDTRKLRQASGMKAKEDKSAFDQAVTELQGTMDIVISGIQQKVNEAGEVNGWSATAYQSTERWMSLHRLQFEAQSKSRAAEELVSRLEEVCTAKALAFLRKILSI